MTSAERDHLAAEYVLGLGGPEDHGRAEAMARTDPDFAASLAAWHTRFSEIDASAAPRPVPGDLWARIETDLSAATSPAVSPAPSVARRRPAASRIGDLWASVAFWRWLGGGAALASLALVAALAGATRPQVTPIYVAVLQTDAMLPGAVVNTFLDGHAELVPLRAIDVPAARQLQVWTLWDRARGPVSVGLIDRAHAIRLQVENLPLTGPDQLFEITVEPQGGSPTGRPTGPILMKGTTLRSL